MSDLSQTTRLTIDLYRRCVTGAGRIFLANLWMLALPVLLSVGLGLVGAFVGRLGMLGGFVYMFALAAGASALLAMVGQAIRHGHARKEDLVESFGQYLWSVINVFFIFWIVRLVLGIVIQSSPQLAWLSYAVSAVIFVLFNAVPELIYQGHQEGLGMLGEAVDFLRSNLLEWLIPLAIMLAPFFLIDTEVGLRVMATFSLTTAVGAVSAVLQAWLPLPAGLAPLLSAALASIVLLWIMLFRGLLFRELHGSSRRQREFAARARWDDR